MPLAAPNWRVAGLLVGACWQASMLLQLPTVRSVQDCL